MSFSDAAANSYLANADYFGPDSFLDVIIGNDFLIAHQIEIEGIAVCSSAGHQKWQDKQN